MTTAEMAGFWRRIGRRVVEVDGTHWYSQGPGVMTMLPDHGLAEPTHDSLVRVARRGRAAVVRYASRGEPTPGRGLFVCADPAYDLGALHPKARSQTRAGLAHCRVERVAPAEVAEVGYGLNQDTWVRQGRSVRSLSAAYWGAYCRAADETDGFEAWVAYVGSQVGAYVLCACIDGAYTILFQGSATELLSSCPNNALTFCVTRDALSRRDVEFVSYGLRSVEATPGLDHYKQRMGFDIRPHREGLMVTPLLRHILSMGGGRVLRALARGHPSSDLLRKAATLADTAAT